MYFLGAALSNIVIATRESRLALWQAEHVQALLQALRPDLKIEPLRGNLDTRLRKLDDGLYDGIVLAAAWGDPDSHAPLVRARSAAVVADLEQAAAPGAEVAARLRAAGAH